MRNILLAAALLLPAVTAQAQPLDHAGYQRLFSAASLGLERPEESLRVGFTQHYRGAVPHSAFAFAQDATGRTSWQFASGRATPEQAREDALRFCARSVAERTVQAECRVLAEDGRIAGQDAAAPVQEGQVGPFRRSALHWLHGPAAAKGVVIWGHGLASNRLDLRSVPVPGFVAALNDAGWDVLRHDRHPASDELNRSLAELLDGLAAVRAAGYRSIILAGQSRGGWQSLLAAARQPEGVVAVVATAPARHSDWRQRNNNLGAALDDFRQLASGLDPAGPRILVALFDNDDFDPDVESRVNMLVSRGEGRPSPLVVLWPESGARSHNGGSNWRFTRDYAACVLALVTAPEAKAPRGLRRSGCR